MNSRQPASSGDRPSQPEPSLSEETTFQTVQDALLGLWEVANTLTTIPVPRRQRYCVTIFGSARLQPHTDTYDGVKHLASELTEMGCDIVTGGGPGLMQAANEGSVIADPANRTRSIGVRIDLGFEQEANPCVEQLYCHRTFFSRLHHFVLLSDAFVVVPGGIGTALEFWMIWQLLQVRKLQDVPLIVVGPMWAELVDWAGRHMMNTDRQLIDPADLSIPHCATDFEAAIAILRQSHTEWTLRGKQSS